jgi:hypothetical protein
MTEVKSRCDHPKDCRNLNFDLLDRPYYYCTKCESDVSVDEAKEKDNEQQTLR